MPAAASADAAQLLQSMARELAAVGHEVEQLKASMEQLKASQQQNFREAASSNLRIRIAATPPPSATAGTRKPMTSMPPRKAAAAPAQVAAIGSQHWPTIAAEFFADTIGNWRLRPRTVVDSRAFRHWA